MKPGIYHNLPFDDYRELDAVNNGKLSLMARSAKHCKNPAQEETNALQSGRLAHIAVLEPLDVLQRHVVMPKFAKHEQNVAASGERSTSRTKWVQEQEEQFRALHVGKEMISQAAYDEMLGVAQSVAEHAKARKLLHSDGDSEVTIVWEDEETGLLCKGRMDRLCLPRFADLKTSEDLNKFRHSFRNYGYYRQMAFYQDGYAKITGEILEPWIVAVEKKPPYCVQAAPVADDALEYGRQEYQRLLRQYAECLAKDHWPGPESPDAWRLPEWAMQDEGGLELVIGNKTVRL